MMLATHLISRSLHPPWGLVDTKWTENFLHKCDLSCLVIHWSLAAVGEREGIGVGLGLVDWQEICLLFPSLPGKTPELWIIAIRPHPPHLLPTIKPTTETPNNKASTQHGD